MRWLIIPSFLTACSTDFEKEGSIITSTDSAEEPAEEPSEEPSADPNDEDNDEDGFSTNDGDCDDDDDTVNPDAEEIPGDGIDNDCEDGDAPVMANIDEGDLVITEIMNNPNSVPDEDGEWFEIYNNTNSNIDLTGLIVWNAGAAGSFTITDVSIQADSTITLGNNDDPSQNGGIQHDFTYSNFSLSNTGDQLVLEMNGSVIDEVDYRESGFPNPDGASMSLSPDQYDADANDDGANWCESSTLASSGDYASPGAVNGSCAPPDPDADGDGYDSTNFGGEDCDDTNPNVNPGALENSSNGIDDDCDGQIDEATNPNDLDEDGYDSLSSGGDDCDDNDASVNPAALEIGPNNIDENCDFILEDGLCNDTCSYPDDGACDDGGANATFSVCDFGTDCSDCGVREDNDQDGAYEAGGWPPFSSALLTVADCDDSDAMRYPEATDFANDGIDQDCDGTDYTTGLCEDTCSYPDDGACDDGGPNATFSVCDFGTDCTDCSGRDDSDQDGFYDDQATVPYDSTLESIMDCDDSDPLSNPYGIEIADDGIDQDCDGQDLLSICDDSCGFVDGVCDDGGTDSLFDICDLGTDCTDCGPRIDEDEDLYDDGSDCDDREATTNPGIALDECDGVDNDCDGAYDEDFDTTEPSDSNSPTYIGSLDDGTLTTSGYLTYTSDVDAYTLYSYDGWTTSPDFQCEVTVPIDVDADLFLYDISGGITDIASTGFGGTGSVSFTGDWLSDDTGDYTLVVETYDGMSCSTYSVICYYN
jgi:hypothetical protein